MKIARDIADTLFELMNPEPNAVHGDPQREIKMAMHAGSMAAVITSKLIPIRDALISIGSSASHGNLYHADAPDVCDMIAGKVQDALKRFDDE